MQMLVKLMILSSKLHVCMLSKIKKKLWLVHPDMQLTPDFSPFSNIVMQAERLQTKRNITLSSWHFFHRPHCQEYVNDLQFYDLYL